ncbi:MAG: restriction endonuclease [Elusimicrobia bacterium]|nr:restriction endonuclease [Elusimicrobiota bacterium]
MTSVYCVRADSGNYTRDFLEGGYAAIGWSAIVADLSGVKDIDELYGLFRAAYPKVASKLVVGQNVGQVARFLLDMKAGDYVVTPAADTEFLNYGTVGPAPSYYYQKEADSCPYRHRREVEWAKEPIKRGDFSVPFQSAIRCALTVFTISQSEEFLEAIGIKDAAPKAAFDHYDPYRAVLQQILKLDDKEFEILAGHLLTALGFEGSEVVGKSGDGGVDAKGELNIANLAKIKIFVQAKRYQLGAKVSANVVKQLRQAVPRDGQGAFITTADYQEAAAEVALDPNFPRIGLINGRQLVDLLIEHWDAIPREFRDQLGLKPGLVRA